MPLHPVLSLQNAIIRCYLKVAAHVLMRLCFAGPRPFLPRFERKAAKKKKQLKVSPSKAFRVFTLLT